MLHIDADGLTERIENNLPNDKEENSKGDMAQSPTVVESIHKQDLHHHIDRNTDCVEDVDHHEHSNGRCRTQPHPPLKGEEGNKERNSEHAQRT